MALSDKSGLQRFMESKRSHIENDPVYQQILSEVCKEIPFYVGVDRDLVALRFYLLLQNTLSWDTMCVNCSRLMDKSYDDYVQREQIQEALAKVRVALEQTEVILSRPTAGSAGTAQQP